MLTKTSIRKICKGPFWRHPYETESRISPDDLADDLVETLLVSNKGKTDKGDKESEDPKSKEAK